MPCQWRQLLERRILGCYRSSRRLVVFRVLHILVMFVLAGIERCSHNEQIRYGPCET
jgi:hypothetical protein